MTGRHKNAENGDTAITPDWDEDEDSEFCRMLADETPEDDGYRISHEDLLAKYGIQHGLPSRRRVLS
jgi:hypothetical protein